MIRYDDFLNGSSAAPEYQPPAPDALPTRPQDGMTDSRGGSGVSSRAVLIAFFALFALLVFTHVLTLDVQA